MPKKQSSNAKFTAAPTNGGAPTATLKWPNIPPLPANKPPPMVNTLLDSQIMTLPLFSPSLSQSYLLFFQTYIVPSLSTTPSKPKAGDAVRVNDRFQIQDESFADMLWRKSGLAEAMNVYVDEQEGKSSEEIWGGEVVGLNPNIRIYRYRKGQFFDKHYDDSNNLILTLNGIPTNCHTTYTLLIYLTSSPPIIGGETVFYTPSTRRIPGTQITVNPAQGMALLHAHGPACLMHEGKVVGDDAGGLGKWILRSDIVVRS